MRCSWGVDSIEAGRYTRFDSMGAYFEHLHEETERIIAEIESERKAEA